MPTRMSEKTKGTSIKKRGEDLDVRGLVIHQVIKQQGDDRTQIKLAKKELSLSDKAKNFVSRLHEAYYKKSRPVYGSFKGDNPNFKNRLNVYLEDGQFLPFSVDATIIYEKELKRAIASTGGFLVFSHYKNLNNNKSYLLVLTINNKEGYLIKNNLSLDEIENIDISKLDVACLINLTQLHNYESGIDTSIKSYLSFVSGLKDFSRYFQFFIDCDSIQNGDVTTSNMLAALDDYFNTYPDLYGEIDKRKKVKLELYNYCHERSILKEPILLELISGIVNPVKPESFMIFAGSDNYQVSSVLNINIVKLRKRLKTISYKGPLMSFEIDRSIIGRNVKYNKVSKTLVISELTQEVIDQLNEE